MSLVYYTDGATSNNGYENSSGGYGVVALKDNKLIWQYQDKKAPTTNNEMELMAILKAFKHIESLEELFFKPIIYTDSAYCCNLINDWMFKWARNGWKRSKN